MEISDQSAALAIWPFAIRVSHPPWSVDELEACFVVTDSAGQKLAYVYFEDERGARIATSEHADELTLQVQSF